MLETIIQNRLIISAIAFVLGLVIGFLTGFTYRKNSDLTPEQIRERFSIFIAVFVTFLWAGSVIVDMVSSYYETPLGLHLLTGMSVGFLLNQSIPEILKAMISLKK